MLEGVAEDEWVVPTDCTGWTVRDLAGHLLGAMRSAALNVSGRLPGTGLLEQQVPF